ncbi:MAG: ABC transporter ATP-binding protein [Oscillibacter sp.]|nr:ABC transporter ATP-binding protein [Oscillibacter sp.]
MKIEPKALEALLNRNHILKGVDMDIGERELAGIIGPNGSGKSTLLKLKPSGGAVYLDGRSLDSYAYKESARRMSVVAQHNYYHFEFTVQNMVLMGRAPHKRALDRDNAKDYRIVAEVLEMVGMSAFVRRSFSTLSGGEQRVILARALAQQAPCLILDEPTNHLDIKYRIQLMDLVRGLDRTELLVVSFGTSFNDSRRKAAKYKRPVLRPARKVTAGFPSKSGLQHRAQARLRQQGEPRPDQACPRQAG